MRSYFAEFVLKSKLVCLVEEDAVCRQHVNSGRLFSTPCGKIFMQRIIRRRFYTVLNIFDQFQLQARRPAQQSRLQ